MDKNSFSKLLSLIGFQVVIFAFLSLLLSNLFFLCGLSINALVSPISFLSSLLIIFFTNKLFFKKISTSLLFLGIITILYASSVLLAYKIYDTTWDGIEYHQETILAIVDNGWKPLIQELTPQNTDQGLTIWVEHYAKGSEIISATIYAVFHKIETAKAINLLFILSSLFLSFDILYRKLKLSIIHSFSISLVVAFNPISLSQMLTFCVDGVVASLVIIFICTSFYLIKNLKKQYLLVLISTICILVNIKFTAILYAVIGCISILLFLFVRKHTYKDIRNLAFVMMASGLIGIGFLGFNPYFYNTLHHGSPFFPLAGESSVDIMTVNTPSEIKDLNKIKQMIFTHFAFSRDERQHVKPRFPLLDLELREGSDLRVGGFGPLFMEISLIAILISIQIWKSKIPNSSKFTYTLLQAILLCSVLVIPESWWARYVPQLYLIPIISAIVILRKKQKSQFLASLLLLFLIINTIFVTITDIEYITKNNKVIKDTIKEIKDKDQTVIIYKNARFGNSKLRFVEAGIPCEIIENKEEYDLIPNPIGVFPVAPFEIKLRH